MSIPLLRELHQDVRRLVIAGSPLAADDTRLLKALPALHRLGESAPIFKRVADGVAAVTEASREHATTKLLDLLSLLLAILHTQGNSDVPGELSPVGLQSQPERAAESDHQQSGRLLIPYRKLSPVIEALTTRGSGRLEIIRQAYEDGIFKDFRTYVPAVEALSDAYSEIADFVADTIIPAIGKAALPILRDRYSRSGGSADARRLACICKLSDDTEEVLSSISHALEEGSAPVKLSAVALAAGKPEFEQKLLEMTDERKADIREAALLALSSMDSDAAADRIAAALLDSDSHIAVVPAQRSSHEGLRDRLLQVGKETNDRIINGDKEPRTFGKLISIVEALKVKLDYPEILAFFKELLLEPEYKRKSYKYMLEMIAEALRNTRDRELLLFLHELRDIKEVTFGYSVEAALFCLPPAEVYDIYETYLSDKRNTRGKLLLATLGRYAPDPMRDWARGTVNPIEHWDERWAERLLVSDEVELVCRLVKHSTPAILSYLLEKVQDKPDVHEIRTLYVMDALRRLQYDKWPELLLGAMEQTPTKFYYISVDIEGLIKLLPARSVPRLRALSEKLRGEGPKLQLQEIADGIEKKANAHGEER